MPSAKRCLFISKNTTMTITHSFFPFSNGARLFLRLAYFCVMIFLLPSWPVQADENEKRGGDAGILIINSYKPGYVWSDNEQQAVIDVLRRGAPDRHIDLEYMDSKHHADDSYLKSFRDLLLQKYRHEKMAVIVVMDNPAFDFVLKNRKTLFADTPIVFCGINNYHPGMHRGDTNITGVAQNSNTACTLELMLRLHPQTGEILVINDDTITGLSFRKEVESILPQFSGRVYIRFNDNVSIQELMSDIKMLPSGQLILLQSFLVDKTGRILDWRQTTEQLTSAAAVPVYGVHEERLGLGIVGGRLLSGKRHGSEAAEMVLRILAGEKASAIPVATQSDAQYMFDDRALKRFQINPAMLPPESIVVNRPEPFFNTYRKLIIIAAQIFFVLCLVIGLLMFNLIQRRRAAAVLEKSEKQFRLLADNAPDAIFIQTNERFAYVNEAFCRLVGAKTPQDVLGSMVYSRFHQDSHNKIKERIRELNVERHRVPIILHKLLTLDNAVVAVEVAAVPFEYQDKNGALVFARDVSKRIAAEEALRLSEERFRSIVENTEAGYFFVELNGKMAAVNQAWLKMYGYERKEDVIGRNFMDLQKEDDIEQAKQIVRGIFHGDPHYQSGFFSRTMKNGQIGYHTYTARAVRQGDKIIGVEGFLIDTTALRRAEEALRASEKKFRSLFDSMNEGVALFELICDDSGRPVDYCLLDANPAFEKNMGIAIQKVKGRLSRDVFGVLEPPYLEFYANVVLSGIPAYFETYFPSLEKHFNISVFSPDPVHFATVFQDITARKTMEEALATEKERLLVTLRSIGDGVITTDIKGRVVLLNKAAEKLTAWTQDEAAGRPLTDIFCVMSDAASGACVNPVERVLASGSIIELSGHSVLVAKDKTERIIAPIAAPIRDRDNEVIGIVLVFRDTTSKKRVEDAIRSAEKLEAIGILAGGIAHDFNNLLGGIYGYLEMIKRDAGRGDLNHISACVSKALSTYERAKHITQQLLTFSKGGSPICKVVRLDRVIRESVMFILSGSNVSANFRIPDKPALCNCDEAQIIQAIDNIVLNARDSMKNGGQMEVSLAFLGPDETPKILRQEPYFVITVRDHGVGIAKDHLPYIFDPFFTTRPGGSGLGLATSYSIIKKHNGLIEAESELGVGAVFRIYLPRAEENRKAAAGKPVQKLLRKGNGNILIMDDEDFILEVVCAMLKERGYNPVTVRDGDELLRVVREASRKNTYFSAAILDLMIPGGRGGRETVRELMEIDKDLMVIAASGYSDDPVMAAPSDFGFDAKLIKPFGMVEMEEVLKGIIH